MHTPDRNINPPSFYEKETLTCESCGNETSEIYPCERCGALMGSCCQAAYTQFSQIDFNCCKSCAETKDDYDD